MLYDGNERKTPKYTKDEIKKKFPVWLSSHPPVYEVEVDCFPKTPKTTKWERVPNLIG